MRKWLELNPSKLVLARGELISFRLAAKGCRISCVAGRLWVTASGRVSDTVLLAGNEVTFTGPGAVVVQALRTATVRLETSAAAPVKASALLGLGRLPAGLLQ